VAHELKNPLTSLRSAVETWPLAKSDESRTRLLDVIKHDVNRLDRLISDISDASRLDAELARNDEKRFNVAELVSAVVAIANGVRSGEAIKTELHVSDQGLGAQAYEMIGHDSRISQVINNLIDNAKSFSDAGAAVHISLSRLADKIQIIVDDEGPGIPAHALERIFERFYTDRPDQGFGQNSGLGLSISRQIIAAHNGSIWAENRHRNPDAGLDSEPIGARFVIQLPAANP